MTRIGDVVNRAIVAIVGTAVVLGTAAACDDPFEDQDTIEGATTLFSLSREELLGQPSALSLAGVPSAVVVEGAASGDWDIALAEQEPDGFVLLPAGTLQTQGRGAIYMDTLHTFEERTEAPGDADAYNDSTPVPVRPNAVYVIRSRQTRFCRGAHFSKLHATEIDEELGSVRFEYILNPNCNARELEPPPPPEEDDDGDGG